MYDTNTYTFRNAKSEENIYITMGYDYKECSEASRNLVKNFVKSLHEDDLLTSYLLKSLTTTLIGDSLQLFHVWTGKGSNGKSLLSNLLSSTLGKY